ncbi:hypothetical protein RRG08_054436 [Elysia crispata]|uniref:Uncharacterized protein n=1 Tax=Elysia crispata TaxID=231223 RepID=A0AAE1AVT4_9GAST|nr:hypothetical protein RRG08_054436 [Elysia crispata]
MGFMTSGMMRALTVSCRVRQSFMLDHRQDGHMTPGYPIRVIPQHSTLQVEPSSGRSHDPRVSNQSNPPTLHTTGRTIVRTVT